VARARVNITRMRCLHCFHGYSLLTFSSTCDCAPISHSSCPEITLMIFLWLPCAREYIDIRTSSQYKLHDLFCNRFLTTLLMSHKGHPQIALARSIRFGLRSVKDGSDSCYDGGRWSYFRRRLYGVLYCSFSYILQSIYAFVA
jgi:hypothetical protein